MTDWHAAIERQAERYRDGQSRLGDARDAEGRQRQLTRIANAAYAAGLAALMAGEADEAREWLDRAATRYRESLDGAPPDSWGRPIGALKARLLGRDEQGAEEEAALALELGAAESDSPIGRYAAALALLVLGRDDEARLHADAIRTRDDFPRAVGDAVATIAAGTDAVGYVEAVEAVLESFEQRDEYLEDVPVADTVLALQALAARRDLQADLDSPLLPEP